MPVETPLKSYGVELRVFEPKTPRINSPPPWTLKTNTNLTLIKNFDLEIKNCLRGHPTTHHLKIQNS